MATKTQFKVSYWNTGRKQEVARFSDYKDAMLFAQRKNGEVHHKTGLVGQYSGGQPTEEFAEHHRCAMENC